MDCLGTFNEIIQKSRLFTLWYIVQILNDIYLLFPCSIKHTRYKYGGPNQAASATI